MQMTKTVLYYNHRLYRVMDLYLGAIAAKRADCPYIRMWKVFARQLQVHTNYGTYGMKKITSKTVLNPSGVDCAVLPEGVAKNNQK
jgi:hypothetical protein